MSAEGAKPAHVEVPAFGGGAEPVGEAQLAKIGAQEEVFCRLDSWRKACGTAKSLHRNEHIAGAPSPHHPVRHVGMVTAEFDHPPAEAPIAASRGISARTDHET